MRGRLLFGATGLAFFLLTGCHRTEDAQSPAIIDPPKPTQLKVQDLEQRAAAGGTTAPLVDIIKKPEAQALDPNGKEPLEEPLTCLARTVYWEARGESNDSMEAVANVVMNRLAHNGFPKSICEVVKQGREQGTCQFSWWCDGRSDHAKEDAAYATAKEIARRALNLELTDRTNGALYFHHKTVLPTWATMYVKTTDLGDFEFYRPPPRDELALAASTKREVAARQSAGDQAADRSSAQREVADRAVAVDGIADQSARRTTVEESASQPDVVNPPLTQQESDGQSSSESPPYQSPREVADQHAVQGLTGPS